VGFSRANDIDDLAAAKSSKVECLNQAQHRKTPCALSLQAAASAG
jgi:hypothetical protein